MAKRNQLLTPIRARKYELKSMQGHNSPHAKFTPADIVAAIEMKLAGFTSRQVSEKTKIDIHYISLIMAGRTWRNIDHPLERLERWRQYIMEPFKGGLRYAQPLELMERRLKVWEQNLGSQYQQKKNQRDLGHST